MRESLATLVTQTANEVVGAIVANIPDNVMHALELEQRDPEDESPKEVETRDAPSRGYQLCPHASSNRGCGKFAKSRMHLFAVAGLLVTGALVIYTTALHMGYLGSEEVEAALFSTLPSDNFTIGGALAAPPIRAPHSGAGSNSSVGEDSSAAPNPNIGANSSRGANSSVVAIPSEGANSNVETNSSVLANSSVDGIPSASANSSVVAYSPPLESPSIPLDELPPTATIDEIPGPIPNPERVYFQNMSETWHSMSDTKLLRKATSGRRNSSAGTSKLAFLFMVRGALPFAPLWERFFRDHGELFRIYIHAHPDYVPDLAPSSPFFGRFVPSKVVQWGRLSVYEAERRLLGNALLEPSNSWFLLLSESCIPLFSFPETYAYFNNSPGVNFIESYEDLSQFGQGRLYRGRYKAMAPEITSSNFRKGSQWFQITRDLALTAARDSPEYTKFKQHFCAIHPVCYIDEHFMATLAWIEYPNALAFRTLTYFAFRGFSPHPKKFAKRDTNKGLMKWLREGHNCTYNGQETSKCFLFARKFDPDALGALLDLAEPVMGIP